METGEALVSGTTYRWLRLLSNSLMGLAGSTGLVCRVKLQKVSVLKPRASVQR